MTEPSDSVAENLQRTARVIEVVTDYVRHKTVIPFSSPEWKPREPQVPGQRSSIRQRFSETFNHPFYRLAHPGLFLLYLVLFPLLQIEWVFPSIYLMLPSLWSQASLRGQLATAAFLVAFCAIPLACAASIYWFYVRRFTNRGVPRDVKAILIGITLFVLFSWIVLGTPRFGDFYDFAKFDFARNDPQMAKALTDTWNSSIYIAISYFVFYVPALCLVSLLLALPVIACLGAIVWAMQFHDVATSDAMAQFLQTPLLLPGYGDKQPLISVRTEDIDSLLAWSDKRSQVIQNKLIPTTLLLAVIAILVDALAGANLLASWPAKLIAAAEAQVLSVPAGLVQLLVIAVQDVIVGMGLFLFVAAPTLLVAVLLSELRFRITFRKPVCLRAAPDTMSSSGNMPPNIPLPLP